jgi:membrane protease YdiL (CAAX protease family)
MQRRSLMATVASIALDAPARAPAPPRAGAIRAQTEPAAPAAALRIDANTVAVLLLGAVIIVSFQSFGSAGFFERNFAGHFEGWPKAGMYDFVYWFGSSVAWLFVLPVLVIALMPRRRLRDFGFGLGDWRFGVRAAIAMYAVMLPVLAIASFRPNFIDYYPMSGWVRDEIHLYAAGGSNAHLASFVLYEMAYAAYFIGWEFFHRGFLTIGLQRSLGWYAVFVVAIPFGILHVGKPMPEAYGAIIASVVLGWLAVRTRSSWYGFALHASIAITMDVLAVAHQV